MYLRIIILFLLLIFINPFLFSARKETNIWYFGQRAGIDFNSGTAVAITDGQLNSNEGCATICDGEGNLLFYTDGRTVWNKNHEVMPNGTDLFGHTSSTQSSVIVPKPLSNNLFYIFTTDDKEGNRGARYSLVDMNLNSGLGDIVEETKNVLLFANSVEKIVVIDNYDCSGVWVIFHEWNSNVFRSYFLDYDGIDDDQFVESSVGITYDGTVHNKKGYLKAMSDGSKIASANGYKSSFEIFDFNDTTGVLSNPIRLSYSDYEAYGVEFSPDGTKLYVTVNYQTTWMWWYDNELWQYDIVSGDENTIKNSRKTIATQNLSYQFGALQQGPDGKIYVARESRSSLGVINSPNNSGAACNYQSSGLDLAGRECVWGLPFFVQMYFDNKSYIEMPNLKKKIGDKNVAVPIYANLKCSNTDTLNIRLKSKLTYDYSLFHITKFKGLTVIDEVINEHLKTITFETDSVVLTSGKTKIAELVGDVLLGWETDTTAFHLDSAEWSSPEVTIFISDGRLETDSICASEIRRIRHRETDFLSLSPNPVTDILNLEIFFGDNTYYKIGIANSSGQLINQIKGRNDECRTKMDLNIDVSSYNSGTYYLRFQTNFNVKTKKFIIIK